MEGPYSRGLDQIGHAITISAEMFKRIEALVKGVSIDLDEEIDGDVSL